MFWGRGREGDSVILYPHSSSLHTPLCRPSAHGLLMMTITKASSAPRAHTHVIPSYLFPYLFPICVQCCQQFRIGILCVQIWAAGFCNQYTIPKAWRQFLKAQTKGQGLHLSRTLHICISAVQTDHRAHTFY